MVVILPKVGRWTTDATATAIRSIRVYLQENQEEFAVRFNVWQTTVSRWETGRAVPTPGTLMALLRLATVNEQKQGILAALDAAGISTSCIHITEPVSANLQVEGKCLRD